MGDGEDELEAIRSEVAAIAGGLRELLLWEESLGAGIPPTQMESLKAAVAVAETAEVRGLASALPAQAPDAARLRVLSEEAAACTACGLHTSRNRSVFSRGSATAELVFVGEGPGANEDEQGVPFVGRAGELLDKMVAAMGLGQDEIYVCNVVKCRPPQNRTPEPDEAAACSPFLKEQLAIVKPKVIVALGRCAAENLGLAEPGKGGWRGRWGEYEGIPVMPTYHPAYLLRSPDKKKPVWTDLKSVVTRLGRVLPKRR